MNWHAFFLPILAQVRRSAKLEEIAEGFQHDDTQPMQLPGFQWFISVFIALSVLLLVLAWWNRMKARYAARFSPLRLFAQSIRAMGIGLVDRLLLRMMARSSELDQPVVMLFSPALLEQQIAAWIDGRVFPPFRRFARARLSTVMDKVFVDA